MIKRKEQASLKVGDCLHFGYCADKNIIRFEEYNGTFDFVARIAAFADGSRMSLEKGHYYETEVR